MDLISPLHKSLRVLPLHCGGYHATMLRHSFPKAVHTNSPQPNGQASKKQLEPKVLIIMEVAYLARRRGHLR